MRTFGLFKSIKIQIMNANFRNFITFDPINFKKSIGINAVEDRKN